MSTIYLNGQIAYREDILSDWEAENPVLKKGEPAIIRDGINGRWLKIGDGVTPFNDLPYKLGPKGEKGDQGEQGIQGIQGEKGDKGEKGDSYILTEADKNDIADIVLSNFTDVSEVGQ